MPNRWPGNRKNHSMRAGSVPSKRSSFSVRAPGARGAVIPLRHGITVRNRLSERGSESERSDRPAPAPKCGPESRAPPGLRPNSRIAVGVSTSVYMSSNGGRSRSRYTVATRYLWRGTGYQSAELSPDNLTSRYQCQKESKESEKLGRNRCGDGRPVPRALNVARLIEGSQSRSEADSGEFRRAWALQFCNGARACSRDLLELKPTMASWVPHIAS